MNHGPFQSDGRLDPLQEAIESIRIIARQPPSRVVLVLLFILVSFVVGAALSGIIENLATTWVQNSAGEFLGKRSISNAWVLAIGVFAAGLVFVLGIVAWVNYQGYQFANTQLREKATRLNVYEGELSDRTRLLEECRQRSNSLREELDEIIRRTTAQRLQETGIVGLLDNALIQMIDGLVEGHSADQMLERFFGVFKRTVPRLFAHPEQIRNICLFQPDGDYLRLLRFYTVPLPEELADRVCFYIGDDEFKQGEMGPEGKLYLSIHSEDSNLDNVDPVVVRLSDRLQDQAESHPDYRGFFGMIDLPAPFRSYALVPVSRRHGILRIESEDISTFGEDHFTLLRQLARRFHIVLLIHSLSLTRGADEEVDHDD